MFPIMARSSTACASTASRSFSASVSCSWCTKAVVFLSRVWLSKYSSALASR
jgi:hypothetical protein